MIHRRKLCRDCGRHKTLRYFYKQAGYAGGHMAICKECKIDLVIENRTLKQWALNQ